MVPRGMMPVSSSTCAARCCPPGRSSTMRWNPSVRAPADRTRIGAAASSSESAAARSRFASRLSRAISAMPLPAVPSRAAGMARSATSIARPESVSAFESSAAGTASIAPDVSAARPIRLAGVAPAATKRPAGPAGARTEPSTPVAVPAADHPGSSSCEWR